MPSTPPAPSRPKRARGTPSAGTLRIAYAPDPRRYYPQLALRRGIQGSATIGFIVDVDGSVLRAWVIQGSGSDLLDHAAVTLVHAYRFVPPGRQRRTRMPITFQLAAGTHPRATARRTR